MAIIYTTACKEARMQAVLDTIGGNGLVEIGTEGMATILATFTLDAIAGTATGPVLNMEGMPKTVAATATGTALAARIRSAANVDVITGLVVGVAGTSGADVIIDNVSINQGQNVTLTGATFTHA